MLSCIYRGTVEHRRTRPVEHRFRYRLFWLYLDLDEWPLLAQRVRGLSAGRFAPAAFYRADHLGNPAVPLAESVRAFVRRMSGQDLATGPIRLLTQPRSFGFYFSPLNLYYCFGDEEEIRAVVAEVNNTPWGEQHCYLLWRGNRSTGNDHHYRHAKEFHVSPFMGMDQSYAWQLTVPGEQLELHLAAEREDHTLFEAGMQLARQPLTSWTLAKNLARSPVNAGRVLGAIYYQAFRLWMKQCPYYPHPEKTASSTVTT